MMPITLLKITPVATKLFMKNPADFPTRIYNRSVSENGNISVDFSRRFS
jgi:hypothetical protein